MSSVELVTLNSDGVTNCDDHVELMKETVLTVLHIRPTQENEFFAMHNVKETSTKNKKNKKRHKTTDLMDVINTEMALMGNPIIKNVIHVADHTQDEQMNRKLLKSSIFYQTKRHVTNDAEYGYYVDNKVNDLSPVFSRVSENKTFDDPIMTQYVQPKNATDLFLSHEKNCIQNVKFLNLELSNLKLKHHHKFSLEKLLVAKFLQIYDEYKSILDNLNKYNKDIKINRETKNNLTEQLMKLSSKKEDVLFDPTLRKYIKQLIESKVKFMNYKKKYKETINKIICLWSDITMAREKMDIITTIYQIEVIKTTIDEDTYEQKWTEIYNQELSDAIDRLEYDYVSKYMEYKQYKHQEKHTNDLSVKIHKPKLIIDEELIKENVQSIVEKIVNKEEVTVLIKNNNNAVHLKLLSMEEALSYCFKIYVDNNFVCESSHYNSNGNFDIHFTETFSIEILPNNNTLLIDLYENNEKVSNYTLALGGIKTNPQSVEAKLIPFKCDLKIAPNVSEVGSGYSIKEIAAATEVRLKSSNLFKDQLCTEFEAMVKVGWNTQIKDNPKIKQYMAVLRDLNNLHTQKPFVDKLKDVIEHIYEKDISDDVSVMETIKYLCSIEGSSSAEEFSLTDSNAELMRLKLLHLRNSGKYSDLNNEMLPLYSSQLSTEQLIFLQKSNENECEVKYSDTDKQPHLDPIEMQRYTGFKYIMTLNRNILKNLNENLLKKTYKDVVCEFKDFNPRFILNRQANLTPLNYISRSMQLEQLQFKEQELLVTIYRGFNLPDRTKPILSEESADEEDDEHVAGFKMKSLRPFVRVSYKEHSAQTTTAIGCYPAWNETFTVNIGKGPSSFVRINLYDKVKENVSKTYTENTSLESRTVHYRYCNRWLGALDIPLTTILSTGKLQGTFKLHTPSMILGYENRPEIKHVSQALMPEVIQLMKKDSIYISMQICTKTVNSRMNRFNQPSTTYEDDYVIKHLNDFISDHLKDFPNRNISLTFIDSCGQHKCVTQFLQPLIHPDFETFPKNTRVESAMSKRSFSKSSTSSQPKSSESKEKKVDVDVESAESVTPRSDIWTAGKSETSLEQMLNCIARYVSLIPIYDAECYSVTLLGTELLKVLHGSPLDHTLILASYFIYLGVRCWVVVGTSLTRGLSSYVLIKYDKANRIVLEKEDNREKSKGLLSGKRDGKSCVIFDATSAEKYDFRDVSCPLKMVFYVFNNDNIWVNVQSTVACESVAFDFSKSSEWRPVFDESMFVSSPAIISDAGLYVPAADTEALRAKLEAKIKAKVQKWRSRTKTIWNRYCSTVLRELLLQWECWAVNANEAKPSLGHKLKQLLATYKMFGFPLNMPYTNNKSVLSAIKCTAVHLNDDPSVEFALAVNMFSYPNNVISVWVFLASITRV